MTAPPIQETEEQKVEREKAEKEAAEKLEAEKKASTQPTNSPPVEDVRKIMQEVLGETTRQNQQLKNQIAEMQKKQNEPPPADREALKKEFYNDPIAAIEKVVSRVNAPLNDFVAVTKNDNAYANIKNAIRNNPQFASKFPKIEATVDNIVRQALDSGSPLSEGLVYSAVLSSIGLVEIGQVPGVSFRDPEPPVPPANKTEPRNVITPPHLAPSSPPLPNNNSAPRQRELTENEKRLARASKLSDKEYLDLLEGDSMKLESFKKPGGK